MFALLKVVCLCFLSLNINAIEPTPDHVEVVDPEPENILPHMLHNNVKSESFVQLLYCCKDREPYSAHDSAITDIYEHLFRFIEPNMVDGLHGKTVLRMACESRCPLLIQSMLKSHNESISQNDFDTLMTALHTQYPLGFGHDIEIAVEFIRTRIRQ